MKTSQLSHNAALLNTIFAICMGFTIAEDTADDGFSLTAGVSKLSLAVVSCTMIAVWIMVVIIFCWTLRKEIHDLFIKVSAWIEYWIWFRSRCMLVISDAFLDEKGLNTSTLHFLFIYFLFSKYHCIIRLLDDPFME